MECDMRSGLVYMQTHMQYMLRAQQALCDLMSMYESGDEEFMHVPLTE